MELSQINLLDLDRFATSVPHEWFTYLRQHAPVCRHPEGHDGPGFWIVTRYDDVVKVNRDAATYSSEQSRGGVVALEDYPPMDDFERGGRMMLTMDAPDHTRYRSLVNRGFTPRMINALSPHIREITVAVIERALKQGACDFVTDIAAELPLEVIAELLGVPLEDRHKVFQWSNRMIGSMDPEYSVSQELVRQAQFEMFMYAGGLAAQRRAHPRDESRHHVAQR